MDALQNNCKICSVAGGKSESAKKWLWWDRIGGRTPSGQKTIMKQGFSDGNGIRKKYEESDGNSRIRKVTRMLAVACTLAILGITARKNG